VCLEPAAWRCRPSGRSELAIATEGLTKRFGVRMAVDSLALEVPQGVVSGFVGPNGAGKTTTIRLLLGLVRPTAGAGTVLGAPLSRPAAYLNRVGAMIEGPACYPTLSGRANLMALARLGGIPSTRVAPALERVGLARRADDTVGRYSHGMKQRLGIAAAVLAEPELLVLDEPTNGLDPAGIAEIRGLLRVLADDGVTVFVSSHLLAEIEQICDHLVMIRDGRLVFQGGVADLLTAQTPSLVARPEHDEQATDLAALAIGAGRSARLIDGAVHVDADAHWAAVLNRLAMRAGITLIHLSERRPRLEEAFFNLTSATPRHVTPNQDLARKG
jgi:ABC-2 type transport system ATP-binding protein